MSVLLLLLLTLIQPAVSPMEIIAHRGASEVAPENTLAALREAIRQGTDLCEVDVRATADGKLVLLHDATVDRTSDGAGKLSALSFQDVSKLDFGSWKGAEFASERIPTLAEALAQVRGKCGLLIEIKDRGIEEGVVKAIRDAKAQRWARFQSFDFETAAKVKRLAPEIQTGFLLGKLPTVEKELVDTIARAKAAHLSFLAVSAKLLTVESVEKVHEAGLSLYAWTVNSPEDAARLRRMGIDALITDRPGDIRAASHDEES